MPLPPQKPFYDSLALLPGFFAATGTGKTLIGAEKVCKTCFQGGCDALIVTPEYKQNRRGPQEKYTPLLAPVAVDPGKPYNHNDQVIAFYNCQGTISKAWFATGKTAENLYGGEVGIIHLDEVCLMEPECEEPAHSEILRACGTRARQPIVGFPNQVIVTGTPEDVEHWTYKLWGDPNRPDPEDTPWWSMTIYENPYRSAESVKIVERITKGDEDFARQMLYGEWITHRKDRIFQGEWFPRYDEMPDIFAVIGSWDTAGTTKEYSSYTVGQIWGVGEGDNYYLLDLARDKLEYAHVKDAIRQVAQHWKCSLSLIENKGTGQPAIQELGAEGLRIVAVNPNRDKQQRASQSAVAVFEGRVHLPSKEYAQAHGLEWLGLFESEVFRAPFIMNWDITDAMSQFITWADQKRHLTTPPVRLSVKMTYGREPAVASKGIFYGRAL